LKPRRRYQKAEDAELLEPIRRLVDERPTYGYRRIGALLNREGRQAGLAPLNHKRLYRLMAHNGLPLRHYTGKPPGRAHDGQISSIGLNLRWTSDSFEIPCWNGEVVRVAFALDSCDREAITWCASAAGISGEMIRGLMLEAVEKRFDATITLQPIQWLSDNGSAYRAHETVEFAVRLGLIPVLHARSESAVKRDGGAFVKTFKRDYVYVHDRPDAQTVLSQLSYWFEDYNEVHPHKALRPKSPREFIRGYLQPATCPA